MAQFRGTVEGNRSEASRLGSKASGLTVNAASWQGAVNVELWYNERKKEDWAEVTLQRHHGAGVWPSVVLYRGPVSRFENHSDPTKQDAKDAVRAAEAFINESPGGKLRRS
jgi:hypothetical protein